MSALWKTFVDNLHAILGVVLGFGALGGVGVLVRRWVRQLAVGRVAEAVREMELRLAHALSERQAKAEPVVSGGGVTPLRRRDDVRPISQEALDHAAKGIEIARGLSRFSEDLVSHMQETLRRLAAEAGLPPPATPETATPAAPAPAEAVCQDPPAAATPDIPPAA